MRSLPVVLVLLLGGALLWWSFGSKPAADRSPNAEEPARRDTATQAGPARADGPAPGTTTEALPPAAAGGPWSDGAARPSVAGFARPAIEVAIAEVAARAAAGTTGKRGGGTPAVPALLAFQALNFVGVDPDAEKTWMRAIDDPNLPAGVRSDLIEDLNDEGYTDNGNPGKADLPLIRARLELIERLAPYAMDQVNADAFEEAYKDLLEMYVRLGGEPRR